MKKVVAFWFRRDLRLEDNCGLSEALKSPFPVLPLFIFDECILSELPKDDDRVTFIYEQLLALNKDLNKYQGALLCMLSNICAAWKNILSQFDVQAVYCNEDYEPYATERDAKVKQLLVSLGVPFYAFKDQVIFSKNEVLTNKNEPYLSFTPYKNKWIKQFDLSKADSFDMQIKKNSFVNLSKKMPNLDDLEFEPKKIIIIDYQLDDLENYQNNRDYPSLEATSYLSLFLRFGVVSVRSIIRSLWSNQVFISQLIWREFFMQFIAHFPWVEKIAFKKSYRNVVWKNTQKDFDRWKAGETGYPFVDAGMRQLNETGYMHNRSRMVVASFLCKHLLIDWRWGEEYFSKKLLDFDLAVNNGNWQWAASVGCDAAPYYRIFNPTEQLRKYDNHLAYVRRWVSNIDLASYPSPMVEHQFARQRALHFYQSVLDK